MMEAKSLQTWSNLMASEAWTFLEQYSPDFRGRAEEGVTSRLIMKSKQLGSVIALHPGELSVPSESKSGADFEVWFVDDQRGSFGWRVQAKRISTHKDGCRYHDVFRTIGKTPTLQIEKLIEKAAADGLAPWYWLYNTPVEDCSCVGGLLQCERRRIAGRWPIGLPPEFVYAPVVAPLPQHSFVENGIVAVPALSMRALRDGTDKWVTVDEAMGVGWHLRCLLQEPSDSRPSSLQSIIKRLHLLTSDRANQRRESGELISEFTGLVAPEQDNPEDSREPTTPRPRALPEALHAFLFPAVDSNPDQARDMVDSYLEELDLSGVIALTVGRQ